MIIKPLRRKDDGGFGFCPACKTRFERTKGHSCDIDFFECELYKKAEQVKDDRTRITMIDKLLISAYGH